MNEDVKGTLDVLEIPIFPNSNPVNFYNLIPTKQTLTPGLGNCFVNFHYKYTISTSK